MSYILEHTVFWDRHFSWAHLLAIVVFLLVCFFCHRKMKKMKEEEKDLEDAISAKSADEAMAEADKADGEA